MVKPDPAGATFAERAAAARGDKDFERAEAETERVENSTFAERAGKAVGSGDAENKAVKSAAKKSASKKS